MAHDPLYALEKLGDAVHALATGAGRVQERLGEAATRLDPISRDELPDDEMMRRMLLVGITDDLKFEQGKDGRLLATLRNLNDEDASALAGRILELYQRLDQLLHAPGSAG